MKLFLFVLLFPLFAFSQNLELNDLVDTNWTLSEAGCRDSSLSPLSQSGTIPGDGTMFTFIDDRNLKVVTHSTITVRSWTGTYHINEHKATAQFKGESYIMYLQGNNLLLVDEDNYCVNSAPHFIYVLQRKFN